MSGDNNSEKTEQPTPKKRRDAQKKGQIATSKELNKIFALIALILLVGGNISLSFYKFTNLFESIDRDVLNSNLTLANLYNTLTSGGYYIVEVLLFPILTAGCIAAITQIVQAGGITLKEEFLAFKPESFNPVNNFRNLLSFKSFATFIRQITEITIMIIITIIIVKHNLYQFLNLPNYSIISILWFFMIILIKIFTILLGIHLTSSILDLIIEKRNLTKQLMMTHSEVKQEHKNSNGDPEIKKRRQELHRELLDDEGEMTISNSTLVLANPTHIAIVLLYRPKRFKLPIVVAKASGSKAQNIFIIAKRHKIPIIRDIWLARSLYKLGIVGRYVPSSMLSSVADVISHNLHLLPKTALEIAEVNTVNQQKNAATTPSRQIRI